MTDVSWEAIQMCTVQTDRKREQSGPWGIYPHHQLSKDITLIISIHWLGDCELYSVLLGGEFFFFFFKHAYLSFLMDANSLGNKLLLQNVDTKEIKTSVFPCPHIFYYTVNK